MFSVAQAGYCLAIDTTWTCPNNLQIRNHSPFCGVHRRRKMVVRKHSRGAVFTRFRRFSENFCNAAESGPVSFIRAMEAFGFRLLALSSSGSRAMDSQVQINNIPLHTQWNEGVQSAGATGRRDRRRAAIFKPPQCPFAHTHPTGSFQKRARRTPNDSERSNGNLGRLVKRAIAISMLRSCP